MFKARFPLTLEDRREELCKSIQLLFDKTVTRAKNDVDIHLTQGV